MSVNPLLLGDSNSNPYIGTNLIVQSINAGTITSGGNATFNHITASTISAGSETVNELYATTISTISEQVTNLLAGTITCSNINLNTSYFYGSASSATFDLRNTSHSPNGALITNIVQSIVGGRSASTISYGSGSWTVSPGVYNLQANMIAYIAANNSVPVDIVFTVYDISNSSIIDYFLFYTQSATQAFYQNCPFSVVIPSTCTHFGIYAFNSSTNSYASYIDLNSNVIITRLDI